MLLGAARAPSDDTCRLAREWLEGVAQSDARIVKVPTGEIDDRQYWMHDEIAVDNVAEFMRSAAMLALLNEARTIAIKCGKCETFTYIDAWFADYATFYHAENRGSYGITHQSLMRAIEKGRYDLIDAICKRGYEMEPRILEYARVMCEMCYEVMLRAMAPCM